MAKENEKEVPNQTINHIGGECFRAVQEPSGQAVLWGELFREKERTFMREKLREEKLTFAIRETYEIYVRVIWQPEALKSTRDRQGKFCLMLHEPRPPMTTSWCWAKFAKPLFRMGFSVIMIDLPGFGKSTVNQVALCPYHVWKQSDWHLITQVLDALRVVKVSTISSGESCATIVRLLQKSPHQLTGEHVFRNPILNREDIFKPMTRDMTPSAFRELSYAEQWRLETLKEFTGLLRSHGARVWATFDRHSHRKTADTVEMLVRATESQVCKYRGDGTPLLLAAVSVTELPEEDLAEAQIGVQLAGARFLFPSYPFKNAVAEFLSCTGKCADPNNFMPSFSPHHNSNSDFSRSLILDPPELPPRGVSRGSSMPSLLPSSSAGFRGGSSRGSAGFDGMSSRGSAGFGTLDRPGSAMRPESSASVRPASSHRDGLPSPRTDVDSDPGSSLASPRSGAAANQKRLMPKTNWKARNINEALIKAQMGLSGTDTANVRQHLLTINQRKKIDEKEVRAHLDKDLLDEEAKCIAEVVKESMRTAQQEGAERQGDKQKARNMKKTTDQLHLTKGVVHYMRAAAKAMQKTRLREAMRTPGQDKQ